MGTRDVSERFLEYSAAFRASSAALQLHMPKRVPVVSLEPFSRPSSKELPADREADLQIKLFWWNMLDRFFWCSDLKWALGVCRLQPLPVAPLNLEELGRSRLGCWH